MRSTYLPLAAMAFVVACTDAPTVPVLQPDAPNLSLDGRAPPPWALINGELTTDGDGALLSLSFSRSADGAAVMSHAGSNTATYQAWLLVTPGNQANLLRFTNGGTAQFSNGAMLSNVNGKISGKGTMTVDGHTYELSAVTIFTADADCVRIEEYDGPGCATFSAGDGSFSSTGSVWTGILSNTGGNGSGSPPGWDDPCDFECVCINCVTTTESNGKRR